MLELEYTTTADEAADATTAFLTNRPLLNIMLIVLRVACFVLCFVFTVALYNKAARPQDYVMAATAAIWILYHKKINRWVVTSSLKRRKLGNIKCTMKIDEKSIFYRLQDYTPMHIEWKKLRFILKNKKGYIIPLTGLANAGRFMWLPLQGLKQHDAEQQFLDLVTRYKLKIKTVKQ